MSDRPERPPVWVRGGTPYYYTRPPRHDIQPPELPEVRRSNSATSADFPTSPVEGLSSSPNHNTAASASPSLGTSAFPGLPLPSPGVAPAPQEQLGSSPRSPSQTQFMTRTPTGSPTQGSGGSGMQPRDQFSRSSRSRSFGGLATQKRGSTDEMLNMRKQSWREMQVGSDPAGQIFWRRWWDGFTKGNQNQEK